MHGHRCRFQSLVLGISVHRGVLGEEAEEAVVSRSTIGVDGQRSRLDSLMSSAMSYLVIHCLICSCAWSCLPVCFIINENRSQRNLFLRHSSHNPITKERWKASMATFSSRNKLLRRLSHLGMTSLSRIETLAEQLRMVPYTGIAQAIAGESSQDVTVCLTDVQNECREHLVSASPLHSLQATSGSQSREPPKWHLRSRHYLA